MKVSVIEIPNCSTILLVEMRDFIVDDDDSQDENNNSHGGRFNYRKELEETLKTNFRFDKSK
jgi:hypothetical protein